VPALNWMRVQAAGIPLYNRAAAGMISALTPLDFLARTAAVYPDATAVVDGARRFPYREFQARIHRLAAALERLGIGPGDRVAVLALNGAAPLEAHFGPMRIGAVLVMLNTRLGRDELLWILKHCGAKALLADRDLLPVVAGAPIEHVISDYEAFL
jgi:fatty-acyl-CoA synthase